MDYVRKSLLEQWGIERMKNEWYIAFVLGRRNK